MSVPRRVKVDGIWCVFIPDDEWKCPKCGAGYETKGGTGLILEGDSEEDEAGLIQEAAHAHCYACGHGMSMRTLYRATLKRLNQMTCPRCKGTGLVDKNKVET